MTVRKESIARGKGDIIGEEELIARIEQAVRDIIDTDPDEIVKLHNIVCQGEIATYESEGGEPLDVKGKVLGTGDNLEWGYIFTSDSDWKCPKCGTTQVV